MECFAKTEDHAKKTRTYNEACPEKQQSPIDKGFPDDGILVEGNSNKSMIITAAIELEKLDFVREHGAVHNFADALCL